MNQQGNETVDYLMSEENREKDEAKADSLADLPVGSDAQIKGGIKLENVKITSYQLGVLDNNN